MRAIVLAAGQGSRLRPLTEYRPKCLVKLAGMSLLDRQLLVLRQAGIEDITIVTGYQADEIRAPGCRRVHNPDYARTNMVATLFCAAEMITGDDDLLIAYTDIVYEPAVLRAVMECQQPVCLPIDIDWRRYWEIRMADPLADAETLVLDARGRVLELGRKPRGYNAIQGQYIGVLKVAGDRVDNLHDAYALMDRNANYDGKNFANMYMTSFIQHLIDRGWHVQSVPIHNGWLEVDTLKDHQTYEQMYRDGSLSSFCDLDSCGTGTLTR